MAKKLASARKRPKVIQFERYARFIADEYGRADPSIDTSEYDRPPQVLKRLVYQHVRILRNAGALDDLREYVRDRDGGRVTDDDGNPFLLGFRLVSGPNGLAISKQMRSKYAAELLYADRHRVRSELVTAFIASVGTYALIKARLDAGAVEAWGTHFRPPPRSATKKKSPSGARLKAPK